MTWLFDRRREAGRSGPEGVAARPAGRRTATMAGAVRYLRGQRAGPAVAASRAASGKMCRTRGSHHRTDRHPGIPNLHRKETER